MELSFAEFAGGGPLLMVVGRLLLFFKQGRVGVGGCSEFSFSFFLNKEGRGGCGGVMFVNFFLLTHIRYQIMGSEIVLKPAY